MEHNRELEPDSDYESELMNEVELLEFKLTAAGHPPDQLHKKIRSKYP